MEKQLENKTPLPGAECGIDYLKIIKESQCCKRIKATEGSVAKIIMDTRDGFNLNVSLAREDDADDYIVKTPDNKYLM